MDAARQRAYWEGMGDAHETAERDRRPEAARVKKPPARAGGEEGSGMGKVVENEAAKLGKQSSYMEVIGAQEVAGGKFVGR